GRLVERDDRESRLVAGLPVRAQQRDRRTDLFPSQRLQRIVSTGSLLRDARRGEGEAGGRGHGRSKTAETQHFAELHSGGTVKGILVAWGYTMIRQLPEALMSRAPGSMLVGDTLVVLVGCSVQKRALANSEAAWS